MNRKHYLNGQKRLLTEDFTECIPGIVYILAPYIWLPLSNNWFLDKTLISRVSGLEWDSPFKWIIHLKNFPVKYIITGHCYAGVISLSNDMLVDVPCFQLTWPKRKDCMSRSDSWVYTLQNSDTSPLWKNCPKMPILGKIDPFYKET